MFKRKSKNMQMELPFKKTESDKLLKLEEIKSQGIGTRVRRAKVPGGWLVAIENMSGLGMTFYPDPDHQWDGKSVK